MNEITKEQFEAYVDVQESGVTNMFDVKTVGQLSGLEKEQILTIMQSYGELKDKYKKLDDFYEASTDFNNSMYEGRNDRVKELENKLDTIQRVANHE